MTRRIVLAEDNPGDGFLVKEAMNELGLDLDLILFRDVPEALEAIPELEQAPPLGVLLDLNLVRGNGLTVLERFRESDRLRGVPVTVLTSSQSPADRRNAMALGANRYLTKPTTLDEFLSEVGGAILQMVNRDTVLPRA